MRQMIDSIVDTILDRSVVGGYTSAGYRVRNNTWQAGELQRLEGKVVVVSGATSGIGLAAAEGFARLGASVRLLVRSEERGARAGAAIIERTRNSDVRISVCDLSSLESVRECATRLAAQEPIHALVNNAGVMTQERALSADGIELTLATNVVGPFLLTNLLLPLLRESAPARVINVSSGGMYTQRITVNDLQSEDGRFDGPKVYARTKRAQAILTEIWAQRLANTGVVVHAMHPGWVDTPGVQSSLPRFYKATRPLLRTPAQGADTIVWLGAAAEPGRSSGRFWHDRRSRPTHLLPGTRETLQEQERLWAECERLSGWQDPRTAIAARSNS